MDNLIINDTMSAIKRLVLFLLFNKLKGGCNIICFSHSTLYLLFILAEINFMKIVGLVTIRLNIYLKVI